MIQRKQSVYLVLAALAVIAALISGGVGGGWAVDAFVGYVLSALLSGLATVALTVVALFAYGNRSLQHRIVVLAQILDLAFLVVLIGGMAMAGRMNLFGGDPGSVVRLVTLGMPLLAYVFLYLARKGVQADIELIRSMDRLR